MITRRSLVKTAAAAPIVGAGFFVSFQPAAFAQDGEPVVVGSKDFTEQLILGHMYLQLLQDAGIPSEESLNLGGTQIAHEALVNGEISLYPEYTGTALSEVLQIPLEEVQASAESSMASPMAGAESATPAASSNLSQAVYELVKTEYQDQFGLTWLERSPANNTQALAVKRAFAEETGITTISQLAENAGEYTISAPADFPEREDGLLGLVRVYGENFNEMEVLPVTPGLKYQALLDDEAEVVLAFGTDGQISGYDLVVLEDDLGLWPPYNVAPVVRTEVLDAYPEIDERFNAVTTTLTDDVLSSLNWMVDGDEKMDPAEVAEQYLKENGFIEE